MKILLYIGLLASIVLPLFNIPLIVRIQQRRSCFTILGAAGSCSRQQAFGSSLRAWVCWSCRIARSTTAVFFNSSARAR